MKKGAWEKFFSAPAEVLERGVEIGQGIEHEIESKRPAKAINKYWKILNPGLTTGSADDDTSGIATYSKIGAQRGVSFIWLSLFSLPLMEAVQEIGTLIGPL